MVQRGKSPTNLKKTLQLTKGDDWLAGGKDIFYESQRSRPQSGHTPGWKKDLPRGLPQRPSSAVAARALKYA